MDSAKNAVKSFLSKDGKHDTTVHESSSPAVTNETVTAHRHENVIKATDKEVHQDHYHTTVQPVHDTKTLPEQQHFKAAEVEHRTFEHGNDDEVQRRLQAERAQFKDTTTKGETTHSASAGSHLKGEHIHHHVHENIQPVINRQTVEPHVVHTTVPVHEVHHSAAQHHGTTALPAVSLDEFKKQGGSLGGSEQKTQVFEGEPRSGAGHLPHRGDASKEFRSTGHHDQHTGGSTGGLAGTERAAGLTGSGLSSTGQTGSGLTGREHHTGSHHTGVTGDHTTGSHTGTGVTGSTGTGVTGSHAGTGATGTHTGTDGRIGQTGTDSTTHTKPSLLDRLNPLKDADGDGKKGLMD